MRSDRLSGLVLPDSRALFSIRFDMSKKQGIQTKYWCFTSYGDNEGFLWWEDYGMVYLVQQEEACPSTGRIHWQGFVVFETKQRLTSVRKRLGKAHWEAMRGSLDEAADYCCDPRKRIAGGLLVECGIRPLYGDAARSESTKERYKLAYQLAIKGEFAKIEPSMMIRHFGNIMKINTLFGKRPRNLNMENTPGVWLCGDAGVGKTTLCQKWEHYMKDPRHKWFDGYKGEKTIVVDDFAPFHIAQTDILKMLGHQFAFQGETKGGSVWLRPWVTIITSQYMPLTIWDKDGESLAAITRRYKYFVLPGQADEAVAYISQLRLAAAYSDAASVPEEEITDVSSN